MKENYDVIIIGGGAAGLFAAGRIDGKKVAVLDHMQRVGKKILSTGNGRCNLSNENISKEDYFGSEPEFIDSVLSGFTPDDACRYFESIGVPVTVKEGRIYPRSLQASAVLDALRFYAAENGARIITSFKINSIVKSQDLFEIKGHIDSEKGTENYVFYAKSVILATGGLAAPKTGSDGLGYNIAVSFGHRLKDTMPHLAPLRSPNKFLPALSGVRIESLITLMIDDKPVMDNYGELQFIKDGISGIVTFELCAHAGYALSDGRSVKVLIDLLPGVSKESIKADLNNRRNVFSNRTAENMLCGILNKKIISVLCKLCDISPGGSADDFTKYTVNKFADYLKGLPVLIKSAYGYDTAQVTAGGIDTSDIDSHTMESKLCPGLYFAGEILDVTGRCGGYNLHWAWGSAALAAKNISESGCA